LENLPRYVASLFPQIGKIINDHPSQKREKTPIKKTIYTFIARYFPKIVREALLRNNVP